MDNPTTNDKKKLRIVYRSNSHSPLWIVAEKAGIWDKNGLEVECGPQRLREKAVDSLKKGDVDVISGNHHNLYAKRVNNGEDFAHLAQVGNLWTENNLVVADSIKGVQDLKGKKVVVEKTTGHAGLNVWLFLKQEGLDVDKGDVELVGGREYGDDLWKGVLSGDFDATFAGPPDAGRAAKAGATVIPVRAMPMIRGVTLTTTMSFVRGHEEEVRRLLRGLAETIHFFITRKEQTTEILKRDVASILDLQNDEEVEEIYNLWLGFLERKPYPTIDAITNVFALALRCSPEVQGLNPLSLWNTHYLRELDDSGFIDQIYQNK